MGSEGTRAAGCHPFFSRSGRGENCGKSTDRQGSRLVESRDTKEREDSKSDSYDPTFSAKKRFPKLSEKREPNYLSC